MPLPPPILGPQPPLPRITPMNQVMVEEIAQGWMEPDPRITETYTKQPLSTPEEDEYMSYLIHYVVQGDQHIPVFQTMPVKAKARDMNNTNPRPPIQCYKCNNGPHKANECPHKVQAGHHVQCYGCARSHYYKDCPYRHNNAPLVTIAIAANVPLCSGCGINHLYKDCTM